MTINSDLPPMTSLAVTGGTVNLASGVTIATADFSNPGTAAITAAGPLNITSQIKFTGPSLAISAPPICFAPSGSNLNTATRPAPWLSPAAR